MQRNLLIPVNTHATHKTTVVEAKFVSRLIIQRHLGQKLHSDLHTFRV